MAEELPEATVDGTRKDLQKATTIPEAITDGTRRDIKQYEE